MKISTTLESAVSPGSKPPFRIGWTGIRSILIAGILTAHLPGQILLAQNPLTWEQIKAKFETANPTLKANRLNIDESRAAEITAYLRPNPDLSLTADGFQISK